MLGLRSRNLLNLVHCALSKLPFCLAACGSSTRGFLRERFFRFSRGKIEKIAPLKIPLRGGEAAEQKCTVI